MNAVGVCEESKPDAVHRSIAPALIEETTCFVQMLEVCFILGRTPEAHVGNLKVTPEVASRVAVRLAVVLC